MTQGGPRPAIAMPVGQGPPYGADMPLTPQEALQRTIEHREIFHDEMVDLMRQIMRGDVSPTMTAAILTGLRVKKETVGEIAGAATVMREFSRTVEVADRTHLVDIVGTGGDGSHTFNISTCSMFVAAAAGARIAKHGNRSVSSKSGSADVLEALGVSIELRPEQVAQSIVQAGIGFMFAPIHHPAMKVVAPVRREMGVRTLFNILGPLTNPAGAPSILMGVFHPDLVGIQARVLQELCVGANDDRLGLEPDGVALAHDVAAYCGRITRQKRGLVLCLDVRGQQRDPARRLDAQHATEIVWFLRRRVVIDGKRMHHGKANPIPFPGLIRYARLATVFQRGSQQAFDRQSLTDRGGATRMILVAM